jgi:hypothetical protein
LSVAEARRPTPETPIVKPKLRVMIPGRILVIFEAELLTGTIILV